MKKLSFWYGRLLTTLVLRLRTVCVSLSLNVVYLSLSSRYSNIHFKREGSERYSKCIFTSCSQSYWVPVRFNQNPHILRWYHTFGGSYRGLYGQNPKIPGPKLLRTWRRFFRYRSIMSNPNIIKMNVDHHRTLLSTTYCLHVLICRSRLALGRASENVRGSATWFKPSCHSLKFWDETEVYWSSVNQSMLKVSVEF